jgi:hypothetical protein
MRYNQQGKDRWREAAEGETRAAWRQGQHTLKCKEVEKPVSDGRNRVTNPCLGAGVTSMVPRCFFFLYPQHASHVALAPDSHP